MLLPRIIAGCLLLVAMCCVVTAHCAEPADAPLAEPNRQPNVQIDISTELLNAVMASNTRTTAPFSEMINGSRYRGRSTTDAQFSLRTEPDDDAIALAMLWQATIASRSHSSTQRTDVSSVSTTRVSASKKVAWNADGWQVEPARASATSRSRITGVNVRRVFGRRTARRRAYEQRSSVDYSVARRAEQRTRSEFDRQIDALVAQWEKGFAQGPQFVAGRSTAELIELELLQANPRQLGAVTGLSTRPTEMPDSDFSLAVHQSAFNNLAEDNFAGQSLREDRLSKELQKRFGWKLAGLEPADPAKVWSIDFAVKQPLQIQFQDAAATVTLQSRGFQVGEQRIPGARLRATYNLTVADGALTATRQGRIEIEPLTAGDESQQVGVRFQVFRSMLRQRFERVFPAEFTWEELPTPAAWPPRATLHFVAAKAADEWLHFECELPKPQSNKVALRAD